MLVDRPSIGRHQLCYEADVDRIHETRYQRRADLQLNTFCARNDHRRRQQLDHASLMGTQAADGPVLMVNEQDAGKSDTGGGHGVWTGSATLKNNFAVNGSETQRLENGTGISRVNWASCEAI
ncbi:hypothetical protein TSUD_327800 [Trifolium subterraneum]|uniref:Uncharacterized protein n=1 Tax=Trifolium subterraneum TaxID=3900 RepID=A0A2Z6MY19_TRISU|nr:hypothetical protein TSUD_327800 [Trifolium subterraneum]